MINLISSEDKKQYLAARRNVVLRKYLISSLLVVMAVFLVYVVGFYMIYSSKKVADSKLEKATRQIFDLRPAGIIQMLDLKRPIYRQI